jgi:glycosyltransferase involved in cell wall biosynthesis
MRLAVLSHKPCWRDRGDASGWVTDGGFPRQMAALSQLFLTTSVVVPVRAETAPSGLTPLEGCNLVVTPLRYQRWTGVRRRLMFPLWLLRSLPRLAREVRLADAVHAPIPGDVGTIGILLALAFQKPLFVRYCGRWGAFTRLPHRFSHWLLIRIAGGRNVVLATGGSEEPPSSENMAIRWIFATSLWQKELVELERRRAQRKPGQTFRVVTVARLELGKNIDALLRAVRLVVTKIPNIALEVVGEGGQRESLQSLVHDLGIGNHVRFHGRLSHEQVLDVLIDGDVFCLPTDSEGFPKAVHEAMACGLPVVTTPVPVLKHLIADRAGILLKNIEPETIAEALVELACDPAKRLSLGQAACEVAAEYSLEAWRDAIGSCLREAWGSTARSAGT